MLSFLDMNYGSLCYSSCHKPNSFWYIFRIHLNIFNWITQVVICFVLLFYRKSTTGPIRGILALCINQWKYKWSISVLQRWPTITTYKFYNNLFYNWTLCHILQWKVCRRNLPWRIWNWETLPDWAVWSDCAW